MGGPGSGRKKGSGGPGSNGKGSKIAAKAKLFQVRRERASSNFNKGTGTAKQMYSLANKEKRLIQAGLKSGRIKR
jgi:hypothetical protein